MGTYGLDCSGLGQGQVAGAFESCNQSSGSIKCGEFFTSREPVSFSGRTLLHGVI